MTERRVLLTFEGICRPFSPHHSFKLGPYRSGRIAFPLTCTFHNPFLANAVEHLHYPAEPVLPLQYLHLAHASLL